MCSHSLALTSRGPGIADLPCVAVTPISLAYSGSIWATCPVPRVARCQADRKARKTSTETSAARSVSERIMGRSRRSLDGEAFHILLGLRRIEGLAHDDEAL